MKNVLFFILLSILTMSSVVRAQIPNKISFQGLLTSPSGALAPDGGYNLKFELFNHPTSGILRFSETQTGVAVLRGAFSVSLGSVTDLPSIFAESLYVQVTALTGPGIGSPVTFLPRSELTSAPYSLAPWVPSGSNISFNEGVVGIGTPSPGANNRLDIHGSDATSSRRAIAAYNSAGAGMFFVRNNKTAGFGFGPDDASTTPILTVRGGTNDSTGAGLLVTRLSYSPSFMVRNDGNIGVGTQFPGSSSIMELSSTSKGLVLTRLTKTQRDAITSPVAGMVIFQTDNIPGLRVYNGTSWMRFSETAD